MAPPAATMMDRQAAFSAGEISPECYGRTDNPLYKQALKLCKNLIPRRHGAIVNRPGTKYVATSATSPVGGIPPRLIPFVFSDGQTFVLEFGNLYVAIYQDGAQVLNGAAPVVVVTPWPISVVTYLKYAQSGDVVTICYGGQNPAVPAIAPQDLERLSNTNWTITPSLIAPPAYPGPAITSPSFPVPAVGVTIGDGVGTVVEYETNQNFLAGAIVSYTDGTQPGGQPCTYYALANVNQVGFGNQVQLPSGTFGPLGGPAFNWANSTWQGDFNYVVNQYVWAQYINPATAGPNPSLAGVLYQCTSPNNFSGSPAGTYPNASVVNNDGNWQLANDASHPSSPVTYAITALMKNGLGVTVESLPTYYTPPGGVFPRYPDRPLALQLFHAGELPVVAGYVVVGFNIYVGTSGLYGLVDTVVAEMDGNVPYFYVDVGAAPDFDINPPAGTNPFLVDNGAGTGTTTISYPGVVSYFQQRRLFARSNAFPNSLWGSAEGNFLDFDQPDFIVDSDSYQFLIADGRLQEIRSILSNRELFIMSSGGEFVASASNGGVGGAITPTSIDVRPSSSHGISYLDPIAIDQDVLDVTAKGSYVRKLVYDWRTARYIGSDISSLVRHLFDGHTIVDWFYAETPDSIVWMVRDDGLLLSLTYDQTFEITAAYAQHTTNAAILGNTPGKFQRVCSVPEGTEDAVYFVVEREVNGAAQYYIERLSSRFVNGPNGITDYRQANFLDCALQYNGRNTGGPSTVAIVTLNSPVAGQFTVSVNATPFVENDATVNNEFVIHPDGVPQPSVDDQPQPNLPAVRLRIVTYVSSSEVVCELDGPAPASWAQFNNTTDWAIARKTFAGLGQLEGCAIGALVDGAQDSNFPYVQAGQPVNLVVGGQVTIEQPGVDVIIGLPYFSDGQLLDIAGDQQRTNDKVIAKVPLEVVNSRGFLVGKDFNHLTEVKTRQLSDGYGTAALLNGAIVTAINSGSDTAGSACFRMAAPMPLTVVAALREVAPGARG